MARELHPVEIAYAAKVRSSIGEMPTETLDQWRRLAEEVGPRIMFADMTGDELAGLCDHEIAARYVNGEAA